ncbi:MAG: hypothetical protein ABI040_10260 [Rhodoferax sp.]
MLIWFSAAFAYAFGRPELAKPGAFVGRFCIVVYWLATVVVSPSVEVFARTAIWTFILGTIVLVSLLGYWLYSGHPLGWQHLTDPALSDANQV